MAKQYKIDEVQNLVEKLQERSNIILTDFSGVTVKQLNELRNRLREKDAEYKVVKNNLFKRALEMAGFSELDQYLKGPIGVTFMREEVGEVAKVLKDFAKDQQKFSYSIGVIDNVVYDDQKLKRIADLPSKDVLLAQTMSLINGPATGIAIGINQIMASLARGIQAVAEAQNN